MIEQHHDATVGGSELYCVSSVVTDMCGEQSGMITVFQTGIKEATGKDCEIG